MTQLLEVVRFPSVHELPSQHGRLTTFLDPALRHNYLQFMTGAEGLRDVHEDINAAYCPISLTLTPPELKPVLKHRQEVLTYVLHEAGITGYNPETAPYSPDTNLTSQPNEVYAVDSGKILGARFFTGHHLLPSSGYGVESQKATEFNRIAVVLMDKHLRISRMQPHRTIYLEYEDFERQKHDFIEVFKFLKQFEPGMGFNGRLPVLLGFPIIDGTVTNEPVDLEETVYQQFPQLQYKYNGEIPIVQLRAENPQIFYEKGGQKATLVDKE